MSAEVFGLVNNMPLWAMVIFSALFIGAAIVERQGRLALHAPSTAVKRFVVCTVLAVALIAGANYIVNPLGVYPTHFLEPIGTRSRAAKVELLQELPAPAEFIILGSSRSHNVQPDDIRRATGMSAFNASVDAGIPRDYLGFALYLEAHNQLPKVFLIGLGLEQMSQSDQDSKYEYSDPLDMYVPSKGASLSVIGVDQTQATFRQLATILSGNYHVDRTFRTRYLYRQDGAELYSSTQVSTEESVTNFLSFKPDFSDELNEQPVNHLRSFLALCKAHHIKVIIYIPPYHPRVLTYYEENTRFPSMEQKVLNLLTDLQKTYSFDFFNFIDVRSFSGDSSDLRDHYHPSDAGQHKIVAAILRSTSFESDSSVF